MIMYKDWEGQAANSITVQVAGFLILMVGVYILTVTRDAAPGCAPGFRMVSSSPHAAPDSQRALGAAHTLTRGAVRMRTRRCSGAATGRTTRRARTAGTSRCPRASRRASASP